MAEATGGQRSKIKRIIEECFKPDTTFRDNEGGGSNPAFSQMPVECILAEIRCLLWDVGRKNNYQYIKEYFWFKTHYEIGTPWRTIAEWFGNISGQPIDVRVDDMLDAAIDWMPQWLANRCLDIYDDLFTKPKPIVRRAPRVAPGLVSLLDRVKKVC
jgi:hypothetical protein